MNNLLFISTTLLSLSTFSQSLLIPEKSVTFDSYLLECEKPGYICTHDYFKNQILSSTPNAYYLFLDNLNLENTEMLNHIETDIENILKTDFISIEQVKNLILVLEKSEKLTKKSYRLIEDLNSLLRLITKESHLTKNNEEQYLIFKTIISKKVFKELSPYIRQFKFAKITPYTSPYSNEYLITGTCEQHITSEYLVTTQTPFQKMFNNSCNWTEAFHKSGESIGQFASENKTALIWTTALIGAFVLLNKYQVTLSY